jgi:hypothetical protein
MFLRLIPAIPCGQALVTKPASGNFQSGADRLILQILVFLQDNHKGYFPYVTIGYSQSCSPQTGFTLLVIEVLGHEFLR